MAADQIVYLEKFVESTNSLPADITRILNTIKDLDERSDDLAVQIQENVELVLAKAPALGSGAAAGRRASLPDEVADLRARIEADQALLVQFAEEKVQLAVAGYDLLDTHLSQLDVDMGALQEELMQAFGGPLGGGADGLGGGDSYGLGVAGVGVFAEPAPAQQPKRGSRLRDVPSYDSLEPLPDAKPSRKITLSLSRQTSGLEGGDAMTPGVDTLSMGAASARRPPTNPSRKGPGPQAAAVAAAGQGEVYHTKRRAAQAAVHAAAAAVAAMEEDELQDGTAAGMAGASAAMGAAGGVAAGAAMQAVGVVLPGAPGSVMAPGAAAAMQYPLPPLIPGLKHAAEQPQAPGRLLTNADINESLVGRRAELYWPDDNLWYLIEIASLDLATRQAQIIYNTGEAESLDLAEIVREGHMSLIINA